MKKSPSVSIGMRFMMRGSEFEITFISSGKIRFAPLAGGRIFHMPVTNYQEFIDDGNINIIHDPKPVLINIENGPSIVRKNRYIESAFQQLKHLYSRAALKNLILKISEEINDSRPPAPSTLIDWIRKYSEQGESSLSNRKNRGNSTLRFDPTVEDLIDEAIRDIYLKPEKFNASDVLANVIGRLAELGLCNERSNSIKIPSLRTIQYRLKKIDPVIVARARQGELTAQKLARAAGSIFRSDRCLSIVEMDTHLCDVFIVEPDTGYVLGRPYLTQIIDVHTRAVVGTYISLYPPSSITALGALKDLLTRHHLGLPGGVPVIIVIDNGIEFKNTAFFRLCSALCITISFSQVRDPDNKPHIERYFGTLTRGIIQKMPGTTFSNPVQKGRYDSEGKACFTLEQIKKYVEEWINERYHTSIHRLTGRAPILMWEEQIKGHPPLSLTVADANALARRPVKRTVRNGRVLINHIEYFSHALATLQAQGEDKVTILIDDLDLNSVLIENPFQKNELILANSIDPEYTKNLTSYMHEEALKERKKISDEDIAKLGKNANLLALYRLLQKIHTDSKVARKWIKKLTDGKSRTEPLDIADFSNEKEIIDQDLFLSKNSEISPYKEIENSTNTSSDHEEFISFELDYKR